MSVTRTGVYSNLVRLLENHASADSEAKALRDSVINRAVRCRSKSRALAAALLQHADLMSRLYSRESFVASPLASKSCGPVTDDFDYSHRGHGVADALVTAAMQAVRSGHDAEARAILDGIGLRRLRLHQCDRHWPNANEIVRFSGRSRSAALERRAPNLMDVTPGDIHAALRLRKRSPTVQESRRWPYSVRLQLPSRGRNRHGDGEDRDSNSRSAKRPFACWTTESDRSCRSYRLFARLLRTTQPDTDIGSALDPSHQSRRIRVSHIRIVDGPQDSCSGGFWSYRRRSKCA